MIVLSCVGWLLGVWEEKVVGWLSGEVVGWAARTTPLILAPRQPPRRSRSKIHDDFQMWKK